MREKNNRINQAFTLIELLVVISIIAMLLAVIMPSMSKARSLAIAIKSMSNMRQWGIGAMMFATQNDGVLPWEGNKDENLGSVFKNSDWWANSIPKMLGQQSYRQISEEAIKSKTFVPMPPNKDCIFIDPAAKFPQVFTKDSVNFYDSTANYEYQMFFCYVWNSELNNGPTLSSKDDIENVKLINIKSSGQTVLMLEMRTTNEELDKKDYEYYKTRPLLGRHRGDWKRLARRHLKAAHIVFCDGHAGRIKYDYATANAQGSRDPDYRDGNWNKPGLIWNAFGPSIK
jgi:prepilin-type N-terminal cleavage/methylation domain-containing protein/prepilin-type processing-associated H-X9-DG protein